MTFERERKEFVISTDPARLDVDAVHAYLTRSYWASGVPKDVVAKLNADINKVLKDKELDKKLGDQGADVGGSTPEQFGKLIKDDMARWGRIVKESGATVD